MVPVELEYVEAMQTIAALEDRLEKLVRERRRIRRECMERDVVSIAIENVASAIGKLRVAWDLESEPEWTGRKAVFDLEQRLDLVRG